MKTSNPRLPRYIPRPGSTIAARAAEILRVHRRARFFELATLCAGDDGDMEMIAICSERLVQLAKDGRILINGRDEEALVTLPTVSAEPYANQEP